MQGGEECALLLHESRWPSSTRAPEGLAVPPQLAGAAKIVTAEETVYTRRPADLVMGREGESQLVRRLEAPGFAFEFEPHQSEGNSVQPLQILSGRWTGERTVTVALGSAGGTEREE
jgi:hypothetical protein